MTTPRKNHNARPQREPLSDRIVAAHMRQLAAPGEWFEATAQDVAVSVRLSVTTANLSLRRLVQAGVLELRSSPGHRRSFRIVVPAAARGAA